MGLKSPKGVRFKSGRAFPHIVRQQRLGILAEVASASRDRVISCLQRGVGHPEAIAGELGVSRAGVDSHLVALMRLGIVERYNIPSQGSKPRTCYRMRKEGLTFLEDLEASIESHRRRLQASYRADATQLEESFLKGKIDEAQYRQQRIRLEERYATFSDMQL